MRSHTKRLLAAAPALVLAAGAVVLATSAFASTGAPTVRLPDRAEAAAPAPDGLSPVATTRDWQETVEGSIIIRRPR